jgi:NAD(P)H-hydrate epimerase
MKIFSRNDLKKLYRPSSDSSGEDNGSITIIGGSKLFHGAPLLSLKAASRIVDMVFFASPDENLKDIANQVKSELMSFIWVPWDEVDAYIQKSDAVLVGPGLMRFTSESQKPNDKFQITNDKEGKKTREITERLLKKFPDKKWVIDAGSLQTMEAEWIPKKAVLTPNKKEFELLFNFKFQMSNVKSMAEKFECTIVAKGPETVVCSPDECAFVKGGNAGLTKGGTGDVLAGLTTALYAKNDALLAASAASFIEKFAADELYKEKGTFYNADDLADKIPETLHKLII